MSATMTKERSKAPIQNEDGSFSELKVMHSAAGYSVGRMYTDPRNQLTEPGTRESKYYDMPEQAQAALDSGKYRETYDDDSLCLLYGETTVDELGAQMKEETDLLDQLRMEDDEEDDEDEDEEDLDDEDEDEDEDDFDDDFDDDEEDEDEEDGE